MKKSSRQSHRVAVDVGGTFTDLVFLDGGRGKIRLEKVSTTSEDPTQGVQAALQKSEADLNDINLFIHGTTLGLNALLERKGAKAALLTTRGTRDVLEIGRLDRPHMYDILYRKPVPLVERIRRREITERMDYRGNILTPLDEEQTRDTIRWLIRQGIKVFAVCLLHAYANPDHEKRVGEIIREEAPEAYVSLSHGILQEFYEYERTVSTVINASLQPLLERYLDRLSNILTQSGFTGEFLVTRSGGGAMNYRQAKQIPVHTILSGPAGGVQGAVYLSKILKIPNLVAVDAGGTSFDVSLIYQGNPKVRTETKVADYTLLLPVLDMETIGAGGGSIAWIDAGNALQVGPQSAGAHPGPICYDRGGTDPTVTDAAVCAGLIDPHYFLAGAIRLNAQAAERAIIQRLAEPLQLSLEDTARGVLAIAGTKMTGAIREMSIERGYDPREFSLLSYGGAGPLFAASLAERMGIPQVIVPRWPGNFSAWGMLMFDLVQDFVKSHVAVLDEIELTTMNDIFAKLEESGTTALGRQRVSQDDQLILRSIDMKYLMAGHAITVPVKTSALTEEDRTVLRKRFNELHQRLFGHQLTDILQVVNFRVRAVGRVRKPALERLAQGKKAARVARKGTRNIYHAEEGRRLAYTVYDRALLRAGHQFSGPAIVEETASTTVVPPSFRVRVDPYGHLILRQGAR